MCVILDSERSEERIDFTMNFEIFEFVILHSCCPEKPLVFMIKSRNVNTI